MAEARLDNQSADLFGPTPSQTVGPFFHFALPWKGGADLVGRSELGARPELHPAEHDLLSASAWTGTPASEAIEIVGRVLDGAGEPVPDAIVEIWQADGAGHYPGEAEADPHFAGFGRAATLEDGGFVFRTVRPGRVPGPGNGLQAPHIAVSLLGRGVLRRLATRLYFADGEGNDEDPVLARVPEDRRATLIAARAGEGRWRFDIVLQGDRETVFFAL